MSSQLREAAGVYAIWNIKKKKIYIGSSINIKNRIKVHLYDLLNGIHKNPELQEDFNTGYDFVGLPLCYVLDKKDLRIYERDAIIAFDALNTGYNKQAICASEYNSRLSTIYRKADAYRKYNSGYSFYRKTAYQDLVNMEM